MTDIVERLFNCGIKDKVVIDAAHEIESLRQRVKELEQKYDKAYGGWERECEVANALRDELAASQQRVASLEGTIGLERIAHHHELAAIKGKQEPVAYMHGDNNRVDVIHAEVKTLLHKVSAHFHKPLDKSENYTIPLYLHPAPIPEGWQLVPIEPTEEMIDALALAKNSTMQGYKSLLTDTEFRNMAKAMLSAAPKP